MRWLPCLFTFVLMLKAILLSGAIYVIGPQQQYSTITAAIHDAHDGDTLFVKSGFYQENNILINKSIRLIGENLPIVDGSGKSEIFTIVADNVTIDGFKIQHSGHAALDDIAAVKIINCNNIVIRNNILFDNFFGIYIQESHCCRIENNQIKAITQFEQEIGNGIHCWKSDSLQIIANNISGHRDGIYFEFVVSSVVWRNISHDNLRYGLHFMFSNDDSYFTNVFRNNGAGVAVMFTKNVTMMNNHFEENWGDASFGLLLKEISDSYISGNTFAKNTIAIYMEGTNRITLERNLFEENGWAIKIQASCMDNHLINNSFQANTFDVSTNGTAIFNEFESNYWDKYNGYDLNRDGIGDVPYRPLSMYAVVVENIPAAMLLYRSFFVSLLDKSEKIFPTITPDNFIDLKPLIKSCLI